MIETSSIFDLHLRAHFAPSGVNAGTEKWLRRHFRSSVFVRQRVADDLCRDLGFPAGAENRPTAAVIFNLDRALQIAFIDTHKAFCRLFGFVCSGGNGADHLPARCGNDRF